MSRRKHMLRHGPRTGVLAASIAALVATGTSSTVWAQEEDEDEAQDQEESEARETDDVIVVTGTRIRRDDFTAPNATTVVTADDMRTLGVISVADMVNQLPNNVASVSPEANPDSIYNVGASIANLRGLNTFFGTRTLTMVDSRRFVATNNGGGVDLNFIPSALVGRIETVTGGGSATYGADAMAGVVNVILDNNIENIRLDLGYQTTAEGDGDRYNFSFATGTSMLDGRGQLTIGLDYSDQEAIEDCLSRAYCRVSRGLLRNGTAVDPFGPAGPIPYSFKANGSELFPGEPQYIIAEGMKFTLTEAGYLEGNGYTTDCDVTTDATCDAGHWEFFRNPQGVLDVRPLYDDVSPGAKEAIDQNGFSRATPFGKGKLEYAAVPLRPETQRGNLFTRFAYELEGGIEIVTDLTFGQTTNRVLQKQTRANMETYCIRPDNGFLLQSTQLMQQVVAARFTTGYFNSGFEPGGPATDWNANCARGAPWLGGSFDNDRVDGRFDFAPATHMRKDMSEHLDRETNNQTDVMTFTMNANGDLFEGGTWTWDTYITYGKSEGETFVRDWESDNRLSMALDSVIDPLTGEVVCRIDSSDPSFSEYVWNQVTGPGSAIVESVLPDIQPKFIQFYELALREDFPNATDAELTQEAINFFSALRQGCAPFNPFGDTIDTPLTAAVNDFAFPNIEEFADVTQEALSLSFSGDLHQGIGAGPLQMAAGLDWREEETVNRTGADPITARDFTTTLGDNWSGVTNNTEAYIELEMPFLRDVTAAESLYVNVSKRRTKVESAPINVRELIDTASITNYVDSWKASLVWQPVEMMRVRMTRSQDMRAPSARELFQTNSASQRAGGENEILSPFRADDRTTNAFENGEQYEDFAGGNSRLDSEVSITETLGLVFTPVDFVPGLEVAIDYYDTSIFGGIEQLTAGQTLSLCSDEVALGIPEDERQFCPNIVFGLPDPEQLVLLPIEGCGGNSNTGAPGCTPEQVAQIYPYTNVVSIASAARNQEPFYNRGIDLSLSYSKQLQGGAFINGRVLATRFLEQNVYLNSDLGRRNVAGQTGSNGLTRGQGNEGVNYTPTPRIRGNMFMSYNKNAFTVSVQVQYTGTGRLNVQDGWIGPGESGTYTAASGAQVVVPYDTRRIYTVSDGSLPSWTTTNLNFNYDFSRSRMQIDRFERLSAYLNITNVGDRIPDFFSGRNAGGLNTTYFSGMGRQYNAGVRMEF